MKTYYVATTWMYEKEFTVQANSAEEAEKIVYDRVADGTLSLVDGEFLKGSFEVYDIDCEDKE